MADTDPTVIQGKAGIPIELPIAQGPATGYVWMLDLPAGVTQVDDGPAKPVEPGRHLGAASGAALRVVAPKGQFRLSARLVRPWEPDKPQRTIVIHLLVE